MNDNLSDSGEYKSKPNNHGSEGQRSNKKNWIFLTATLGVFSILVAIGYYAISFYAWGVIQKIARENDVEIDKKHFGWTWHGGLDFELNILGAQLDVKSLKKVIKNESPIEDFKAQIAVEKIAVRIQYQREISQLTVKNFEFGKINGRLNAVIFQTEQSTSKQDLANKDDESLLRFPDLRNLILEIPELPIHIVIENGHLQISTLEVAVQVRSKEDRQKIGFLISDEGFDLNFKGIATAKMDFESKGKFQIKNLTLESRGKQVAVEKVDLKFWASLADVNGKTSSESKKNKTVRLETETALIITGFKSVLSEQKLSLAGESITAKFQNKKGETNIELKTVGVAGLAVLNFPVSIDVVTKQDSKMLGDMEYHLNAEIKDVAKLSGLVTLPRKFSELKKQFFALLHFESKKKLFSIPMLKKFDQYGGDIKLDLEADASPKRNNVLIKAKINSDLLRGDIKATTSPDFKNLESNGTLQILNSRSVVTFSEHKLKGEIILPFRLTFNNEKKIRFETILQFNHFNYSNPSVQLQNVHGRFEVMQGWDFITKNSKSHWQLNPIFEWHPFAKTDLQTALESNSEGLKERLEIEEIHYSGKKVGPFSIRIGVSQNQINIPEFRLANKDERGQIQGMFLFDFLPSRSKLGLMVAARSFDLSQVIPESAIGIKLVKGERTEFSFDSELDLKKGKLDSHFLWEKMTPPQILNIINFLDPLADKASFNTIRQTLSKAYPTRLEFDVKENIGAIKISTNIINLPKIQNLEIRPFISPLFESYRKIEFLKKIEE